MKSASLIALTRKQSLKWTGIVTVLTVCLCSCLVVLLFLKDAEREILMTGSAAVASYRTDILSGNIRSIELQLRSDFKKNEKDEFVFLDTTKMPWINNPNVIPTPSCSISGEICRDLNNGKLLVDIPIFYDSENKSLWGFLHIEKRPDIHWEIILAVSLGLLLGMLSLAFLLQSQFMKSIRVVSTTMQDWSDHLRYNPKDSQNFATAPFKELEPIAHSLHGLNKEISELENLAQKRGSLNTLRSLGHDILNPVARMKRIIGVMKLQPSYSDNEFVDNLESNLKRLSGYAEQIKSLYKRETSDSLANPGITDLSLEIKNLTEDLSNDQDAVAKGITFELSLQLNCYVNAPPSVLSRIAENLILNSFHASVPNSTVKVSTCTSNGCVVLCIRDSGSGIPDSIKDKVFDANFTTKTNKGTGLGLFVVKQLCEEHAGTIKFRSEIDQGTIFEVSFPYSGASV